MSGIDLCMLPRIDWTEGLSESVLLVDFFTAGLYCLHCLICSWRRADGTAATPLHYDTPQQERATE